MLTLLLKTTISIEANLILTFHIAGVTEESNAGVSSVTADNVRSVLQEQK